ncbi:MAG: glycoside hydrolase domain-containing protein [Armatimonadota bacterium]
MRCFYTLIVFTIVLSAAQAQNLLPNASFEDGSGTPTAWQNKDGAAKWEATGHTGKRCVSVTGDGENSNYWFSALPSLEPGATYRLSFWGKLASSTGGGCAVSGPDYCNHDWSFTDKWQQYSYVFCAPPQRREGICRFGQWTVKGTLLYDDADLRRVIPTHHEEGAIQLGDGEDVAGTKYAFKTNLGGPGSNYSRLLENATAGFNSNRWCFSPGAEVVYRQQVAGVPQTAAKVIVRIGWYASGNCLVEVSRDKQSWKQVGELNGLGTKSFDVPADVLPAETVYVRLRSMGKDEKQADFAPGSFQVHEYAYEATLANDLGQIKGATNFLEILQDTGQVAVGVKSLGTLLPGENKLQASLKSAQPGKVVLTTSVQPGTDKSSTANLFANTESAITVPYQVDGAGERKLILTAKLDGKVVWQAATKFYVPHFYNNDYGYAIRGDKQADLWWCEGTYKIAQTRPAPTRAAPVRLAAARNEFEPCQVVLRPRQDLRNVTATLSDFQGPSGAKIAADAWTIKQVEYLKVTTPTDESACTGWWPDPLPVFKSANFTAGRNWPLWLTVKVPEKARAGVYWGNLKLSGEGYSSTVPVELHVFDFTMPSKPHLQTAWGFGFGRVAQYQNLTSPEDREKAFDLCMQNFRDHRISPYSFFQLVPISVKVLTPANEQASVTIDWVAFDKAAKRYLDHFGFTSFRLPIQFLPGGRSGKYTKGKLGPFEQGTPEYDRLFKDYMMQLQTHLEQNGWLEKAYIYWFDEPEPADYEHCRSTFQMLKDAAPKITRMLTEQPEEQIAGNIDLWCPVTPNYNREACQARQKLGERIWWYVCCGPKAPLAGLFIDHGATDLRTWMWQTWQNDVQGCLIWESTWWDSTGSPNRPQNPWIDPMGWTPEGGCWGNGDGRFLYPANRDYPNDKRPYVEAPVDSIRWEMLREGLEDWEYLYLLREAINKKTPGSGQYAGLLKVPSSISEDMANFCREPKPIYAQRARLAAALEKLQVDKLGIK